MARLPRLSLAGYPHHILQHGNNRQTICSAAADYQMLLDLLGESAHQHGVALHAYVLLENHFHLLATPKTADGLPKMMQALGRRYVRYFNAAQGRSGTLWEGRYKSTLLQPERYLLPCMVFLDWHPVRAGCVAEPQDYAWSSYGHYSGASQHKLLTPHPLCWGLGNTPFAREAAYALLVRTGTTAQQQQALTQSVLHGWVAGDAEFVVDLQKKTERRLSKAKVGRPALPKIPAS